MVLYPMTAPQIGKIANLQKGTIAHFFFMCKKKQGIYASSVRIMDDIIDSMLKYDMEK